jgi:catechol 2,3-dioxygenase-like lactoylglutathione lyase family enzyme
MMKLRNAMIFVVDLPRMLAFYRDGLGLVPRLDPAMELATVRWVELSAGPCALALHAIPAEIARGIAISSPPQAREDTPLKLIFEADDLEKARAHLVSCGATMGEPSPWGSCDGVDPEGNVFQIATTQP